MMRAAIALAMAAVCTWASAEPFIRGPGAPYPDSQAPENRPPLPETRAVTRPFVPSKGHRTSPDPTPLNLPRDFPDRLVACWSPPPVPENQVWQVTVRLSFSADGKVIGAPVIPYVSASSDDARRAIVASLLLSISDCTPLAFTPSLSRAIAGRIFAIRFILHHVGREDHI